MAGVKPVNSCTDLFKRSEILQLPNEYTFSGKFVVKKQEHFQTTNSAVCRVNTLTDQIPTSHVFVKVHTVLASKFSTIYHLLSKVLR
jgi:hypothetical protein